MDKPNTGFRPKKLAVGVALPRLQAEAAEEQKKLRQAMQEMILLNALIQAETQETEDAV